MFAEWTHCGMSGSDLTAVVDVVLVNWNTGTHLRRGIESLIGATREFRSIGRVIVVDNASIDRSGEDIDARDLSITVIRNDHNIGFAAACNQGARAGEARYILFLNPDVRLREGSIDLPLRFMIEPAHRDYGICSIRLLTESGDVDKSCARFPRWWDFVVKAVGLNRLAPRNCPDYLFSVPCEADSCEVDHVSGAFFLVRRQLFENLGGFDERFFVYLEDLDFTLRARRTGSKCWYCTESSAIHVGGGSSRRVLGRRLYYSTTSRILYSCKHFSRLGAGAVVVATLIAEPCTRLIWAAARRSPREVVATASGMVLVWTGLARLLRKASKARFGFIWRAECLEEP